MPARPWLMRSRCPFTNLTCTSSLVCWNSSGATGTRWTTTTTRLPAASSSAERRWASCVPRRRTCNGAWPGICPLRTPSAPSSTSSRQFGQASWARASFPNVRRWPTRPGSRSGSDCGQPRHGHMGLQPTVTPGRTRRPALSTSTRRLGSWHAEDVELAWAYAKALRGQVEDEDLVVDRGIAQAARDVLRDASARRQPEPPHAWVLATDALLGVSLGDPTDEMTMLVERALMLDASRAVLFALLITMLRMGGYTREAVEAGESASFLRRDPQVVEAAAAARADAGDLSGALQLLDDQPEPDASVAVRAANLLLHLDHPQVAVDRLDAAPPSDPARLVRGLALEAQGNLDRAGAEFELIWANVSRADAVAQSGARRTAAMAAYHTGRYDAAVDILRELADPGTTRHRLPPGPGNRPDRARRRRRQQAAHRHHRGVHDGGRSHVPGPDRHSRGEDACSRHSSRRNRARHPRGSRRVLQDPHRLVARRDSAGRQSRAARGTSPGGAGRRAIRGSGRSVPGIA